MYEIEIDKRDDKICASRSG